MSLSDDALANELRAFAQRFMESCTFETAVNMLASNNDIHDYHDEPTSDKYFEIEAAALYHDTDEDGDYICIIFSAMDGRSEKTLGSVYIPLCFLAFIYTNGTLQFGPLGNVAAYINKT